MALTLHKRAIVLANLGTIRDIEGHEQALTRPCVIIKPQNAYNLVAILPITTSTPPIQVANIKINKGTGNLKKNSFVLVNQIRTISYRRILHGIGQLPEQKFKEVQKALKNFLEL